MGTLIIDNSINPPQKLKNIELSYVPAIPIWRIYAKELNSVP
jgi:hypothetical protein